MWDEIDIKKKTYFYFKFFLMKKIILLVIALVWLSGFGFAAPDYAQGCNNSWKVVDGEQTYNCQICTWQMYKTGSKKWAIQFYKECCPDWSTVYDTICCPSWQFPYDNNKNVVIELRMVITIKNVVKNEYEYEKLSEMNVCLVHLQKLKICQIIQIIVLKMSVIVIQTKFIQMMNDCKNVVIDECLSQILRIRAKRFV